MKNKFTKWLTMVKIVPSLKISHGAKSLLHISLLTYMYGTNALPSSEIHLIVLRYRMETFSITTTNIILRKLKSHRTTILGAF